MRRRVSVSGPLDLQSAWERYLLPQRWPSWAPQIRSVDVAEELLRPRLTGVVRGPLGLAVRFRVDEVDPETHTWAWTVMARGVRVHMRHDLTRTPGATVAGLTVDGPALIALAYPPCAVLPLHRLLRR